MHHLPVLIWAYPREFKTLAAAGQVKGIALPFYQVGLPFSGFLGNQWLCSP